MSKRPTEARTCGRPTQSGKPCQARIYGFDFACGMHASQHDRELAEVYKRGHSEGFQSGPRPYEGVVTELGTTYRGELSFIVGRAPVEGA